MDGSRSGSLKRAKVHTLIVQRAESVAGEPPITRYQEALIRNALQAGGVEFTNGDEPGAAPISRNVRPSSRRVRILAITACSSGELVLNDRLRRHDVHHCLAARVKMPAMKSVVCCPLAFA